MMTSIIVGFGSLKILEYMAIEAPYNMCSVNIDVCFSGIKRSLEGKGNTFD